MTDLAWSYLERPVVVARTRPGGALSAFVLEDPAALVDLAREGLLVALLPALPPCMLGEHRFRERHGLELAYVVGEMAHGIANEAVVQAAAEAGALGFFGAAGLDLERIEQAIVTLSGPALAGRAFGVNLIHQPSDAASETRLVDLLLRRDVRRVSASAFLGLTASAVRLAFSGARMDDRGHLLRRHVFAKVSRPEVARQLLEPAPPALLASLVRERQLTEGEAAIAACHPVADHVTVEADSAGHTDNRPLGVLLPIVTRLRDDIARAHGYKDPPLVGAAGGLGDPQAIASAFALGAAYVLTGSINQAAVEAGTSSAVKTLLAQADIADVAMAPAADMFELGARVQVLKRGTMFAQRAARLGELYRAHAGLDDIAPEVRARIEREIFRQPIAAVEADIEAFFRERSPATLEAARRDPKARMALVFRWYLGRSSRWAEGGDASRMMDFQVWCGPAMGAFNRWAANTPLARPEARTIGAMARALMLGAALALRREQLRWAGIGESQHEARS